jgi:hypothetical protein
VSQETLDAVVAIAGAVNAGVCQAVAGRGYKQPDYPKEDTYDKPLGDAMSSELDGADPSSGDRQGRPLPDDRRRARR